MMTRDAAAPMRVGYLVSLFPCWSETFIMREILALKARGVDVRIFSLKPATERLVHDAARPLLGDVVYPPSTGRLLRDLARSMARRPLAWTRLLAEVAGEAGRRGPVEIAKALYTLAVAAHFARIAREAGLDHLHAHWATYPSLAARAIRRLTGRRYTLTAHAHDLFLPNPYLARNLRDAATVVTISEYNRHHLTGAGAAAGQVQVVPCGLDLTEFSPRRVAPQNPGAIVAVGRLEPIKGLAHLVDACALLKQRGVKFSCDIIGDGSLRRDLDRRIAALALQDQVRLSGALVQGDVHERLSRAEVFALPSVRTPSGDQDGIPVALMEAMALGLPVVTSRVSGIPELVVDGVSGLLVPPGDASALADAIERTLRDPVLRETVAAGGRAAVQARHDIAVSAARLQGVFTEAARPRIAYVIDELEYGGTQRQLLEMAVGFRARGWDVSVLCLQPILAMLEEFRAAGVAVHLLAKRRTLDPGLVLALRVHFARQGVDLVHAFSPIGEIYAGLAARSSGRPFIASLRNSHEPLPTAGRIAQWLAFRLARLVVANSSAGARWAAGHALDSPARLVTVPNGLAARAPISAPRAALRRGLGLDDAHVVILSVGRLVPQKGYDCALDLFESLNRWHPDTRLLIAGDGPERPGLAARIRDRKLESKATLLGSRADVPDLLAAADIYLSTSRHEGMSNSIMEAMAAGLPIVATGVGGTPELIEDGQSGWLFPPREVEQALARLSALVTDQALRARLGAGARERVTSAFGPEAMVARMETLYRSILGGA